MEKEKMNKNLGEDDKKFLHKIQQQKMRKLWDNQEDEVWDNV